MTASEKSGLREVCVKVRARIAFSLVSIQCCNPNNTISLPVAPCLMCYMHCNFHSERDRGLANNGFLAMHPCLIYCPSCLLNEAEVLWEKNSI